MQFQDYPFADGRNNLKYNSKKNVCGGTRIEILSQHKKKNKILTKMIVMISTNYLVALLFDMREKQQREEGSSTNPALKEKRKLKSR